MNEMAAAAEQQRVGIEQVDRAFGDMDGIAQRNAALADQSRRLHERVAVFSSA